ncbi:hypothetical protein E4U55_001564 [Claviceps digitariae]|nr:hypothetical protein E4U55_001564 [Claviceps digitariae]
MARSKRGNRIWKSKASHALSQGGLEQQSSQHPAPTGCILAPRNQDYFLDDTTMSDGQNNSRLTLADIARETSLHDHSVGGARSKLRYKPVHFVSRGSSKVLGSNSSDKSDVNSTGTMTAACADQDEVHTKERFISQEGPALDHTTSNRARRMNILLPSSGPLIDQTTCTDEFFIIDTIGEKAINKSRQPPTVKTPERDSSPDSSSADEVILFRGRKSHGKATFITELTSMRSQYPTDAICSLPRTSQSPKSKTRNLRLKRQEQGRGPLDNEDILQDYISNIRENAEVGDIYGQSRHIIHDLGGSDDDHCFGSSLSDDETHRESYVDDQDGCQHLINNGSISELCHTDRQKVSENNDLSDSSDEEDTSATSAAKTMLGSSSAFSMKSFNDPSAWITKEKQERHNLSQQQLNIDFMDWNQSSVQRVKRSKGAPAGYIPFHDCDSDLDRQLQVAWKNDRQRKKERKQQRQELRALGMLQKRAVPDDLRLKYPLGMTITQVADELRSFLQQEKETIIFPPMDLHARKTVHELANTFNVKSKSVGKAEQRRPSLYRTKRTRSYSEAAFDQAVSQIRRKFLPRADVKSKRKCSSKKQNRSDASKAATNYQEGEIVGAAAPELGIENRGRAMLEKMGWSRGTALGAEDNKGILQPVSLAMKRSKAGLG